MKYHVLAACLSVALVAPAFAQSDDFNRSDAPSLGTNWTQQAGSSAIFSNTATGSDISVATYNGSSGNSVSFDLISSGTGPQYIAAVLGWGSAPNNFFIKVQANTNSGLFDTYGFYTGNNGGGLFAPLSSSFSQASVTASYVGSLATLTINPLGGAQQAYTYDYGFSPTGGVNGLGFWRSARADNFSSGNLTAAVPEPATWAMMILGFGVVAGAMRTARRRQKLAVSYA